MEEKLICEKCGVEIEHERDLLDYEDMLVCEYCLDELRMLDEKEYQDLTAEGFNDYE